MNFTSGYLDHGVSYVSVLADGHAVGVAAEHGGVVIDICQVDVHHGNSTKGWSPTISCFHCKEIILAGLKVQRSRYRDSTCMWYKNYTLI